MKPLQELINKEIRKDKDLKEKTVKKIDSTKELKKKEDATVITSKPKTKRSLIKENSSVPANQTNPSIN